MGPNRNAKVIVRRVEQRHQLLGNEDVGEHLKEESYEAPNLDTTSDYKHQSATDDYGRKVEHGTTARD